MEEQNDLQRVEQAAIQAIDPASPAGLMAQLMGTDGPFDVEGFGKMLEYQEKHEANQARKAYSSDFALAQSDIDAVVKTQYNSQTKSKYAGLDNVLEMARPVYTKHGFSVIYYESKPEAPEDMRLCADVLHKAGHKETYHLDVPLDGTGIQGKVNMTKLHGKFSSVTYGRRYLLCMIWNIPTQDDDGNAPGKGPIQIPAPSKDQQKVIAAICAKIPVPDGMRVDVKKLSAIFYAEYQRYPADMKFVGDLVEWISSMDRPELFIPVEKDDFDKHIDQSHAEQGDMPASEAEATAAAKFGKENEQVPCRYECKKCDREFEEPTVSGKCPFCISDKIKDRQEA